MALEEVTASFLRRFASSTRPSSRVWASQCRRYATATDSSGVNDIESSAFVTSQGEVRDFDPLRRARTFRQKLPRSAYQFKSPKYYRGPLHPHQPLKPSDPNSREFIPGPFSLPRLEQTYHDTIAPDMMTLAYAHVPPGTPKIQRQERLRRWTGDSPYYKNRPLRGPRGGDVLRLLKKPFSFDQIPELRRITVHTMVKGAREDSGHLAVAGMVLQAITGARVSTSVVKKNNVTWGIRIGQRLSCKAEIEGEDMYHFLSKLIDVVMPRFKDYKGAKGSSGDNSGNIALGLSPDQVAQFPEIEINYDAYPQHMLPGCHVIIHTTARTDRDARLLLQSIGVPFYGKFVD